MSSGFRYIFIVLVTAAAVFAGLSLWPTLVDALNNGRAQAAAPTTPAAPVATPPTTPVGAAIASPVRSQPTWTFKEERDERPAARRTWLYAQASVVLRITPGGTGHRAPSITQAPLIILKGTRLWPVRTEGDWVMVKAPSGLLGYVHSSEIDSHIPYCKRKY